MLLSGFAMVSESVSSIVSLTVAVPESVIDVVRPIVVEGIVIAVTAWIG